jgi:trans-aconitate methyltransferase
MIDHAQKKFPRSSYPNLSFVQEDASKLSFENQFDLAFSSAALHWIRDHGPFLRGVHAALKPSGRIFFQMGGKGNISDISAIVRQSIRDGRWRSHFSGFSFPYSFFSPEEYEGFLREAGFIPQRVELIPKDMTLMGREGFAGWIRTTWLPFIERIPENERDFFISDMIDTYLVKFPMDEEDRVHMRMVRLEIEAVKTE